MCPLGPDAIANLGSSATLFKREDALDSLRERDNRSGAESGVRCFYTDHFELPLPEGHRFPMAKYGLLRQRIAEAEWSDRCLLCVPPAAADEDLQLAHDAAYVKRVTRGELSAREIRRIGFPWSPQMVERSRRSVGATIAAAKAALQDGVAVNLAGGTHHAMVDHGEGFCVFNDVAVAARVLQRDTRLRRMAVIDADVHQGNGTAAIFSRTPEVYTFSIHCGSNFPLRKVAGDLDLVLQRGTRDDEYLEACAGGVQTTLQTAHPEIVFYLAGADPYQEDRLGHLSVSKPGLARRDRLVLEACRDRNLPVVVVMAGGYAPDVHEIVDIHAATVRTALQVYFGTV
jgi:acetoin utilization deacetylase AcuC-like enzyme